MDPITFTISKEDKDNALDFSDQENCIISTSLKRYGFQNIYTTPSKVVINRIHYFSKDEGALKAENLLNYNGLTCLGYRDDVVGRTITLIPFPNQTN